MDALELGSIVKPIFIAQALDRGLVKPNDNIHCENGSYPVPGGKIRDDHPHGLISIGEVIKYSSNICTYKLMQKLGRQAFYETVVRAGLARTPGTGLPGEWAGYISKPSTWREMRFANMAFGQGLAISPLQVTRSLAMLAGGGKDRGVSILARNPENTPETAFEPQYVTPETSRIVMQMMSSVVEEEGGTGSRARIPGVSIAGKTGTAQKFSQATKSYSERIASFVGVLPAEQPKLAITVVIDEPRVRPAYGGTLAGPVFANIGSKTIRYLNSLGKLAFDLRDAEEEKAHRERLAQKKKH
jgi:cell division protein FtsI (penicillin-binding protein 3)